MGRWGEEGRLRAAGCRARSAVTRCTVGLVGIVSSSCFQVPLVFLPSSFRGDGTGEVVNGSDRLVEIVKDRAASPCAYTMTTDFQQSARGDYEASELG